MGALLTDLAPETILNIVQRLSFAEVLSLKQVCMRLHWILSEFPALQHLVVSRSAGSRPSYRKWFGSYDPVDCQFLLTAANLRLLDTNRALLSSLRQLFIYEHELSVQQVNCFRQLDRLEFEEATLIVDQPVLCLPKLRHLKLAYYGAFDGLVLDTPKLVELASNSFNFRLQHPQSVLVCRLKFYVAELKSMVNLTHLYCENIRGACGDLIARLPSLQEIHTVDGHWELNGLIAQIRNSNKALPSIYSNGLNVALTTFDLHSKMCNIPIEQLLKEMNNIELFGVLHFVQAIHFTDFEENLQLTDRLTKKLPNLQQLFIDSYSKIAHSDQLARFLVHCSVCTNLRSVLFEQTTLDQSFFNRLPDLLPSLCELTILETASSLSYYFLLRFGGNLQSVALNRELNLAIVAELLNKNQALTKLHFKQVGLRIAIMRLRHDEFFVRAENCGWFRSTLIDRANLLPCLQSMPF